MQAKIRQLKLLFWSVVALRVVSIFLMPLADTTEARYANTALMMSNLNDWITPFFKYNDPFLGKPPLAFWFEALSYKIFGVADFVPRVPSLFITLATVWLIYKLVATLHDQLSAILTALIYISTSAVFILSGVVMTDSFLVFGTTLSLVSFLLVVNGHKEYWRYLFFVGSGIGILTKGPLALVVVCGILTLWIVLDFRQRITTLKLFPWVKGLLLMCVIFVPWYAAQEIKNPGFLYYFIVGENLGRFLDSGWHGDRYGYVHKEIRGTIWIFWLVATLPWGIIASAFIFKNIQAIKQYKIVNFAKNTNISFYLAWSLFIMIFFTLARNVLWYYTLPSIGGFAILLALFFGKELPAHFKLIKYSSIFIAVVSIVALGYILIKPNTIKSEKYLIKAYKRKVLKGEAIYFVGKTSFSATYYMNIGKNLDDLTPKEYQKISKNDKKSYFVVVNKNNLSQININGLAKIYTSKKYILFKKKKGTI